MRIQEKQCTGTNNARAPGLGATLPDSPPKDDLSLVLGGPLYQLYLRTRLATPTLELVRRRVIIISLFCWLPLCLLSLVAGNALSGVAVPFLFDVEAQAR